MGVSYNRGVRRGQLRARVFPESGVFFGFVSSAGSLGAVHHSCIGLIVGWGLVCTQVCQMRGRFAERSRIANPQCLMGFWQFRQLGPLLG